jgi:RNA polymerase primary sigma factor
MRQLRITKQITNRETASLEKYLQEIGRLSLISPEEEVELAQQIKAGDKAALDKMTRANLRFVVSVAKQYQNQGLTLPDLINEGNLGLIKAAKKFDETRGFKFISYAVWWIRQSILQALAEQSRIVRLPLNKIGTISKINQVMSRLEQDMERTPSADEIANELDLSLDDVYNSLINNQRHVSMDASLNSDESDDRSLYDTYKENEEGDPDRHLMTESLIQEVQNSLRMLAKRESEILRLYFGLDTNPPHTLEEIGMKFGLTRERVRQIKEKAIRRLKNSSRSSQLRPYLG